jgi:hypothetical protein
MACYCNRSDFALYYKPMMGFRIHQLLVASCCNPMTADTWCRNLDKFFARKDIQKQILTKGREDGECFVLSPTEPLEEEVLPPTGSLEPPTEPLELPIELLEEEVHIDLVG